jgi:hypothetical protein
MQATSLKRAENIMKNGFSDVVSGKSYPLLDDGIHYFYKENNITPMAKRVMLQKGERAAEEDKSTPALLTFDACICNHVTKEQSENKEWVADLIDYTEEMYGTGNVRRHSPVVKPTDRPLYLFQGLITEKIGVKKLMTDLGFDAVDENDVSIVLNDPNKNVMKETMKIKNL